MIKALIFDFDGVLVLSEESRFKAIKSIAARHGIEIDENIRVSARGKTTVRVLQEHFPNKQVLVKAILDDFTSEYREHITQYVKPIEFTVSFIRKYQGTIPIAIASMSSRQTIERLTKHFGIYEKIAYIVSRDEVTLHKPDPEIYLKAAADLNLRPEECLVFEDTVIGVQSAYNANMSCCVVLNEENNKDEFEGIKVQAFVATERDMQDIINKNP